MALEMRTVASAAVRRWRPTATARICSYECTFCVACAESMEHVCPNCGGELVARPTRARRDRRPPPLRPPAVLLAPLRLLRLRHRCGPRGEHGRYVDALLAELELERDLLAPRLESIYLGGGTPTLTEPAALERLLAALPDADEVTVEANPETVTPELARLLSRNGVNRVSIGAQTFNTRLLDVLERRARPDDVRRAVHGVRDAGIDNISLDLIYGIPGQSPADLARDLAEALALEPEHVSAYELEAKPGTRFTHAHGAELERQAESMETYFEHVVETLTAAGYRWYETANFCRTDERGGRDLRARHNLGYWLGRDYLGIGVGAVSTIEKRRWRNAPSLRRYVAALERASRPPRELEELRRRPRAASA